MHYRNHHSLTLSLVTLLAVGCTLESVEVGGTFRGGDEEQGGDEDDGGSSGDVLPEEPPPNDPPQDEPPPNDPPQDEPPPNDPPPNDPPPVDEGGPLHAAIDGCAFNLVWTKGPQYNQGRGLTHEMVAASDDDSLDFAPSDLNAWVFLGVYGESVLSLELLAVDDVTGELTLGGKVVGTEAVMTLPPLVLDPNAPIVLQDATVQDPGSVGPAILTSLVDNSQQVLDDFRWGLVVDLNGGPNPACEPLLESIYGPL